MVNGSLTKVVRQETAGAVSRLGKGRSRKSHLARTGKRVAVHILVVEDEVRVAEFIQSGLKSEGWTVTVAPDGETGLGLLEQETFDVIVLDLMLPGTSGQDVCRQMRARKDLTPILILSALSRVDDLVAGLRLGADDYLAKPFDFDELLARIEALARRRRAFEGAVEDRSVLQVGPIRFDTQSLQAHCDEVQVELTNKEREILKLFLGNPGRVFSRERILNAAWGACADPLNNVVDVYVARLRKKLGSHGEMIQTVRGAGYRLAKQS